MTRKYAVTQRDGQGQTITRVLYEDPEQALEQFTRSLHGAGHDEPTTEKQLTVLTVMLLAGSTGCEVLDPDLTGSTSLRILPNG